LDRLGSMKTLRRVAVPAMVFLLARSAGPAEPPAQPAGEALLPSDWHSARAARFAAWQASGAHGRAPGERIWDCVDCPEMIVTPAGAFTIGSPADEPGRGRDEGPQRRVTIPSPLAV